MNTIYLSPEQFLDFPLKINENFRNFLIDPKMKNNFSNRRFLLKNCKELSPSEIKEQQIRYQRAKVLLNHYLLKIQQKQPMFNESMIHDLLGCTPIEFRKYITDQFKDGMSWETYGNNYKHNEYAWFLQHIIPHQIFDLTDPVEYKQYMHYTNLRPRLWKDHRAIGKSVYRE